MIDSVNSTISKQAVIIYGGAFNPPTNAHVQIAQACAQLARQLGGEFWLLPSGDRPDKTITSTREMRIQYLDKFVALVAEENFRVQICWDEFDRTALTETIDTVEAFRQQYPDKLFYWVFGADSILTLPEWRGGDYIYREVEKVIVPRAGYTLVDVPPKSTILSVTPQIVSSTLVREKLAVGENICGLVPKGIAALLGSAC